MLGELVQAWLRVTLAACGVDGKHARAHAADALAGKGQKMKAQKGGAVDDDRDELTKTMDMDL